MNIDIIYTTIIEKLTDSNNVDQIFELENSIEGAATGSEALIQQGKYLLGLKQTDPYIFKLIETQVQEYIIYCKLNGLITH